MKRNDNQCVTDCPKNRPYAMIEGNEKKCSAQCDKYINTVKKNGVEKSMCKYLTEEAYNDIMKILSYIKILMKK